MKKRYTLLHKKLTGYKSRIILIMKNKRKQKPVQYLLFVDLRCEIVSNVAHVCNRVLHNNWSIW